MLAVTIGLLIICITAPHRPIVQTSGASTPPSMAAMGVSDSPNAVTAAVDVASYKIEKTVDGVVRATGNGLQAVTTAVSRSASSVGHAVQTGVMATLRGVGSAVTFVVRIPGNAFGFVAHAHVVGAIIKPADHNPVPIIDPQSPALLAAKQALPATQATPANPEAVWPLQGQVTTEFGVPEWPYQAVHTGLDISDGNGMGTTPIHTFRYGHVIAVEHSGGLGNHVVVDHGSGVTSVYGHLASINVQVGQEVGIGTILGYEGSTGVSTGPHLHFEIRVNGQATDPHQFINGQP